MTQVIVIAEGDGFTVADVPCTGGCAGFDAAEVEQRGYVEMIKVALG